MLQLIPALLGAAAIVVICTFVAGCVGYTVWHGLGGLQGFGSFLRKNLP